MDFFKRITIDTLLVLLINITFPQEKILFHKNIARKKVAKIYLNKSENLIATQYLLSETVSNQFYSMQTELCNWIYYRMNHL